MITIEKIREYCIEVDLENVLGGDESIGAYSKNQKPITFTCEKDIRLYYYNISLKDLLKTYSSYNGLECYKADEPNNYRKYYNLDIIELINELNK